MQAVLDYLKQNQPRFLAEFCDYLRFPSVSAQPQHKTDLQACAAWLVAHCQQIGLETKLCETKGHPIVVAKTPAFAALPSSPGFDATRRRGEPAKSGKPAGSGKSAKPHFVVYGHYDVQPPEPLELWE